MTVDKNEAALKAADKLAGEMEVSGIRTHKAVWKALQEYRRIRAALGTREGEGE